MAHATVIGGVLGAGHAGIHPPIPGRARGMLGCTHIRPPREGAGHAGMPPQGRGACRDTPPSRRPPGMALQGRGPALPARAGLAMVQAVAQTLPSLGRDSLVTYELGADGRMVSVSFQSTVMSGVFAFFPRALLVHRAGGRADRALYVFLVAGLAPPQWGGMARVVHLAIPRDESAGSLAHMYETFKAFNPAWAKTRLILVKPGLPEESVLTQAFPAAEVQLSIFHLCTRLQQQIQQMALGGRAERLVLASLNNAMCEASETRRRETHALLRDMGTPGVQPQLCIDWLLNDEIWAAHRKRTWGVGGSYFKDLEIVTKGLNKVFRAGRSLESCITSLVQHYQKCILKSHPDAVMCFTPRPDHCAAWAAPQSLPASDLPPAPLACQGEPSQSSLQASPTAAAAQQQQPVPASPRAARSPVFVLQSSSAAPCIPEAFQYPSSPAAKLQATENLEGDSKEEIKRRAEECIKQSLSDICTEPAARLCLSEFAVVQKSVQLIGTEEDALSIQILEDVHRVDMKDLSSCTCHFNQVFQLPCRHILAVLNLDRRTLQPEMLSRQWQKGCDAHQAGHDSADGLLEILKSSWDESLDKSLVVSFLMTEISRLLTHCSREEFERRYRTLRELADGWIGPYVEVKL
ncbi:zinc finger SWIM domain-containing protein 1 [Athene noctua]|uniref:zinc finger SWIM domain-containing protein 1 n=1 Tax=Athene noctua TaxID=126797 RepID=UPI003EBCBAD7